MYSHNPDDHKLVNCIKRNINNESKLIKMVNNLVKKNDPVKTRRRLLLFIIITLIDNFKKNSITKYNMDNEKMLLFLNNPNNMNNIFFDTLLFKLLYLSYCID